MEKQLNTLFHLRKDKKKKGELYPIYLRVTIAGKRFEFSTQRYVKKSAWMARAGIVNPKSESAKTINSYLNVLKHKVFHYQKEISVEGGDLSVEVFKTKWTGIIQNRKTILKVFEDHNNKVAELVGKDFAEGTFERYKTSYEHTQNFILWKYNLKDFEVQKLNYEFISEYEFWLKSVRNCSHNTTMKYLANFKKIVLICVKNQWIKHDPFNGYKLSKKEIIRDFLTEQELEQMAGKKFAAERLERVRDIFIFCCYTGLAYADILKLRRSEIINGIDGKKWIFTSRQKTDTLSRIPLLSLPLQIIDKYAMHRDILEKDRLLPVLTNQKMNAYLKEIADICGINKELTFHIARHTFATTVTLNNGVPIETVSKMLGHSNIKTTQHYAKLLDKKVSHDMELLSQKINNLNI